MAPRARPTSSASTGEPSCSIAGARRGAPDPGPNTRRELFDAMREVGRQAGARESNALDRMLDQVEGLGDKLQYSATCITSYVGC